MRFKRPDWSVLNSEPLVIKSMYICCIILISVGNSWLIFKSENMLGCVKGLTNISNDNARGKVLMPIFGISFTSVWAVDDGAELTAVGAFDPPVVVGSLDAELGACTVATEDGVVWADVFEVTTPVGFAGLIGLTGLLTLVGLVNDFTQVSAEVVHAPHIGEP